MKAYSPARIISGIHQRWAHLTSNRRWNKLIHQVEQISPVKTEERPVVFFNASTRLQSMSQNAAYSLLASLGLRASGVPVHYFVCNAGIERCILGSNRDNFSQAPPCAQCIRQSRQVFTGAPVTWLEPSEAPEVRTEISSLPLTELVKYKYKNLPLGFWARNSLRWVLRRHTLVDDEPTRAFIRSFIHSGWNVYRQFSSLVEKINPQAVIVFNGMFFPEAAARQVCLDRGIRVVTHEVGIQPLTGFFTDGEATAYPLDIPQDFTLTPEMNARLDDYLGRRFQGDFTMAGIKFWPQIEGLDAVLTTRMGEYKKIVPVFTNVIFDTSQVHANTLFSDMFTWLDTVRKAVLTHRDVLFVIRAHPDEGREGKESRESVAQWIDYHSLKTLPNVVFIDTDERVSSYELIQQAHFVMVYNSTIGLEAILLDKLVLTAAKSRYTQIPTTLYPSSQVEYLEQLESLLTGPVQAVPEDFKRNARRLLYKQLFMSSLPFDSFIEPDKFWKGYVTLKRLTAGDLMSEKSNTMRTIRDAILSDKPFELSTS